MAYTKGLLEVAGAVPTDCVECDFSMETGPCYDHDRRPWSDARNDNHDWTKPVAWLPHSCDQWVIGGIEEIDALIADLQEARAKMAGES